MQGAVAELRYEDLINSNYYPKVESETRDEQKQRFRDRMGLDDGDGDRDDSESGSTGGSAADARVFHRTTGMERRSHPAKRGPVTAVPRMRRTDPYVGGVPRRTKTWTMSSCLR